jgi:SAM-dependent methyltransferase
VSDEPTFFEAYERDLLPLMNATSVLNLVGRATDAGLLHGLRTPTTVDALAADNALARSTVQALCRALIATGVAEVHGQEITLAGGWRALTDPGAFVPLDVVLAGSAVESRLLRGPGTDTFWSLSGADRVMYARSVSPDPYSDDLVAAFRTQIMNDPDRAAMADGGRLLELGCGVAGRVLTTLRAMPELHAVGVELSEDLAAEAHRRADELGLTDRFEVVCADASTYRSDEPFDFGFWSQFFFPSEARSGALRTMHAALRPGGLADAPLGVDFAKIRADPSGAESRSWAIFRVVLDSWGVPERDAEALMDEFRETGFDEVRVVARNEGPIVRAVRR